MQDLGDAGKAVAARVRLAPVGVENAHPGVRDGAGENGEHASRRRSCGHSGCGRPPDLGRRPFSPGARSPGPQVDDEKMVPIPSTSVKGRVISSRPPSAYAADAGARFWCGCRCGGGAVLILSSSAGGLRFLGGGCSTVPAAVPSDLADFAGATAFLPSGEVGFAPGLARTGWLAVRGSIRLGRRFRGRRGGDEGRRGGRSHPRPEQPAPGRSIGWISRDGSSASQPGRLRPSSRWLGARPASADGARRWLE